MQEEARLLMEETGCEQGEAELALELAGNDLEKAITTIRSILRHISALKGKFFFPQKNLYGLVLIVINTKTKEILRLRSVVSYNPALYEHALTMDWYAFEKLIFSYRLDEGSLPDFTQDTEEKLHGYLLAQREALVRDESASVASLFNDFFSPDEVRLEFVIEELNLTQFRQLPTTGLSDNEKMAVRTKDPGTVLLQVTLVDEKNGKEVVHLSEGDVVLSQITDTRDIAHYLAHLIGGMRDNVMLPLPAVVKQIVLSADETEVQVHYAPGIVGVARLKNDYRVRILESKTLPWWKKIIPWNLKATN